MSRPLRSAFRFLPALALSAGFAAQARAQITHLEALSIDQAQEVPPTGSPATGRGDYTVNTFSHTIKYNISFSGLTGPENLAHIHGPAAPGATGPIMISLPLGSPKTGFAGTTVTQEGDMLAGMTYTNIHTNPGFPNGEIRGQMVVSPAYGTPFCFGDGTGAACPCLNSGTTGHGCQNSATTGGSQLSASGHISPDNVVLVATGELPSATSIVLQGSTMVAPQAYGDGLRCAGGTLKRLKAKNATGGAVAYPEGAEPSITARSAALGHPIAPGSKRWYLIYYRDPSAAFCPSATFNSSNGLEIQW